MSANEATLLFKGKADFSQARSELSSFRGLVKREITDIGQDFAGGAGRVGTFAASLGPAGLALGAVAGVAVGLGAGLTAATVKAVELGSRFNDLSLQTGLSVETLSGLDGQLKQSGSSAEALGNAVLFMHKNLGKAAEGNKNLKQTFAELGIKDVNAALRDTDGTLRTVIKSLGEMTSEGERDRLGTEALGRGYKDLRVFIADTGGDIEETLRKAREAGVIMSGEVAGNLDALGDAWDRLGTKTSVFSANFIGIVAPEITKGLDDIGMALSANLTNWENWAQGAAWWAARVRGVMEGAAQWWNGDTWSPQRLGELMGQGADKAELGMMTDWLMNKIQPPKARAAGGGGVTPRGGGGKRGKSKASDGRMKDIQADEKELDADFKRESDALERDYRRRLDTLAQFTAQEISLLDTWLKAKHDIFDREEKEVMRSTKNEAERERKLREIQEKRTAAEDEYQRRLNSAEDKLEEGRRKADEANEDKKLKLAEATARARISAIGQVADLGIKKESDAAKEIGDIQLDLHDKQTRRLKDRLAQEEEGSAEYRRIQGEIGAAEIERGALVEEVSYRIAKAKKAEIEAERERLEALRRMRSQARAEGLELERGFVLQGAREDDFRTRAERIADIRQLADIEREMERAHHADESAAIEQLKADNLEKAKTEAERVEALTLYHEQIETEMRRHQLALGQITQTQKDDEEDASPFKAFNDLWSEFKGNVENAHDSITNSVEGISQSVVGSLGAMEGALRQGIAANILYGDSLGLALKKALAVQLANISAELFIQGTKHAAYAIGSLAFGDFRGAALHAEAAAAFFAGAALTGKLGGSLAKSTGMRGAPGAAGGAAVSSAAVEPRNREFTYGVGSTPASADAGNKPFFGAFIDKVTTKLDELKHQQAQHTGLVVQSMREVSGALSPFRTASAGDIVERGLDTSTGAQAAGAAIIRHAGSDAGFVDDLARNMRVP